LFVNKQEKMKEERKKSPKSFAVSEISRTFASAFGQKDVPSALWKEFFERFT